jgi:hypothetical protein
VNVKAFVGIVIFLALPAMAEQRFLFSDHQGDHSSVKCVEKTYIPFSGGKVSEFSAVLTFTNKNFEYSFTEEGHSTHTYRIDRPSNEPGADPYVKRDYGWLSDGTLEYTAKYFSKSRPRCRKRSNTRLTFRSVPDGIEMIERHEFYRARRDSYGVTKCHLGSSTVQCLF